MLPPLRAAFLSVADGQDEQADPNRSIWQAVLERRCQLGSDGQVSPLERQHNIASGLAADLAVAQRASAPAPSRGQDYRTIAAFQSALHLLGCVTNALRGPSWPATPRIR